MTPQPKTRRLDLNDYACVARVSAWAGRCLLILSALSLLTMPITEYCWSWDRFFETGRDFELGTLSVLMLLCLVLVLSQQRRQCVESFLSLRRILAFRSADGNAAAICLPVATPIFDPGQAAGAGPGMRGFPLQV